jgi:hypothetical protein
MPFRHRTEGKENQKSDGGKVKRKTRNGRLKAEDEAGFGKTLIPNPAADGGGGM